MSAPAVVETVPPVAEAHPLPALDDDHFIAAWGVGGMTDEEKAALPAAVRAQAIERYRKVGASSRSNSSRRGERGFAVLAAAAQSNLIRSDKGVIKACDHNAKELMAAAAQYDGLHFDDFLFRARIGERDWSDHDDRDALCWLQSTNQVPGFTLGQVRTAAMALAYARRRDKLFEFVMGLPEWDGTPCIEHALTDAWGAPDTPLMRAASRNLFVALIARARSPGCQVDCLWVFEGPQGTNKSRAMRALGVEFHAQITAPIGTSDFYRQMRGIWIAELSEMDSLRGREATTIKRILSSPSDRFVEKYEKHAQSYPRHAVSVATTNEATYWQDAT